MSLTRISIPLNQDELKLLERIAGHECRTPRGQARWILINALKGEAPAGNDKPATQDNRTFANAKVEQSITGQPVCNAPMP